MLKHLPRRLHTLIQRGDIHSYKKCRFQAHIYKIETEEDITSCQNDIVNISKKYLKASHPHISAFTLSQKGGITGFDDNGESGAGKRLLTLLENRCLEDTFIAVSRWYGGSHLGGARFRIITKAAKDLL
jgi:putative IMPACT (imprinted ancient) family translation regulator